MSDWQPIETAPKDGTPFLFFDPKSGLAYVGSTRATAISNVVEPPSLCYLSYTNTSRKNLFRSGGFIKCGLSPTHWMPLPEPPK